MPSQPDTPSSYRPTNLDDEPPYDASPSPHALDNDPRFDAPPSPQALPKAASRLPCADFQASAQRGHTPPSSVSHHTGPDSIIGPCRVPGCTGHREPSCANGYPPPRRGSTCYAWMCVTCETEELCHCAIVVEDPRNIADITAASTALEQENKHIKSILASVSLQLHATDSDTRHVDVSITATTHAIASG